MCVVGSTPLWLLLLPEDEAVWLLLLLLLLLPVLLLLLLVLVLVLCEAQHRRRRQGRRLCMLLRPRGTAGLAVVCVMWGTGRYVILVQTEQSKMRTWQGRPR